MRPSRRPHPQVPPPPPRARAVTLAAGGSDLSGVPAGSPHVCPSPPPRHRPRPAAATTYLAYLVSAFLSNGPLNKYVSMVTIYW